jgi:hypothetical protein
LRRLVSSRGSLSVWYGAQKATGNLGSVLLALIVLFNVPTSRRLPAGVTEPRLDVFNRNTSTIEHRPCPMAQTVERQVKTFPLCCFLKLLL